MQGEGTSFIFQPFSKSKERLSSSSVDIVDHNGMFIFNGIDNEAEEASSKVFMDAALWLHCDESAVSLLVCLYLQFLCSY